MVVADLRVVVRSGVWVRWELEADWAILGHPYGAVDSA
jgi:hypothetical protein